MSKLYITSNIKFEKRCSPKPFGQTKNGRSACTLGWFKNPVSSQTDKLMAGTKFSDYLGLNHYKKAKKNKTFHSFKVD